MKRSWEWSHVRSKELYIPHGSDETDEKIEIEDYSNSFISHTVQMKLTESLNKQNTIVFFISHTVQMKPSKSSLSLITPYLPLYPTRFRWNNAYAVRFKRI